MVSGKTFIERLKELRCSFLYYKNKRIYKDRLPNILSSADTLRLIRDCGLSISRYGDGEVYQMMGKNLRFSDFTKDIQRRLIEVAMVPINNHLVCIPPQINSVKGLNTNARDVWQRIFAFNLPLWLRYFNSKRTYGSSFISRYYIDYKKREKYAREIIALWKQVWEGRNLLIVEGENSRLGIGNDLFENAKSIKRVLCPAKNAFSVYDKIIKTTVANHNDELILAALGPTATILAYDLAKKGIQAIDIGHIDIEYEWYKMGAKRKVNIPTKAVNEVTGGLSVIAMTSVEYQKQIVAHIHGVDHCSRL